MTPRNFPATAGLSCAAALLLASCRPPEVRVYLAPRDATPAPRAAAEAAEEAPPPSHAPEKAKPQITYQLPEGWTEIAPGEVSIAAFSIKGDGGVEATANVTPLPDLRGREALVVNMYRQQTGQPAIEQADLEKTLEKVEAAGGPGQMLELVGAAKGKPVRLITVIAHRDGRSWFYRISGDDAFVATLKPAFLDFIKTVKIIEPDVPNADAAPAAAPAESKAQP